MEIVYEIKRDLFGQHDGVQIWADRVVIKERLKGSEKVIPLSAITEVGTNRSVYDMPLIHESLRIVTAGSKYVVRKLPKAKAKEAKETILRLLAYPKPYFPPATQENSVSDLEKLAELKEKGVITEEEFQQKKKHMNLELITLQI